MDILVKWTVAGLEAAALAAVVFGFLASAGVALFSVAVKRPENRYITFRRSVGRTILLALELLIAADILRSLVLELSLMSLAVLAALVAIRTFLSFSIDVELDGCWPWERARLRPCASSDVDGKPRSRAHAT